jgi:Holliday junction resolvase RusA-like endonuclease
MIVLDHFPLAPSSNNLYANVGRRRVMSREGRDFYSEVRYWTMEHATEARLARQSVNKWQTGALQIRTYFILNRSRIFCKDGSPKRLDATNLIKATHDAIAELIGCDDKHFFNAECEKVFMSNVGKEYCIAIIGPMSSRSEETLRRSLGIDDVERNHDS